MAEFARITYNFNSRIILNDVSTDTTRYVLLNTPNITDTLVINTEDEKPEEAGIIDYGSKFGKGQWTVPITLYASSNENMAALIQTLKQAFNPDLLEADSTYGETTSYLGYHPLDWTETVCSTSRAFRIYAKSQETPKVSMDNMSGSIRKSNLQLKVADPRKYLQSATTLSGAGTATNAGTYTTPIVITITASGATSTSLAITNSTTSKSIYVTTALANNDSLVIDTGLHSCKLNGTEKRSLLSGSTEWWLLNSGNNTLAFTNGTNATVSFSWRSAWPL